MIWCFFFFGERLVYDIQWQEEDKKVHATLVLNLEDEQAVLVCRKGMTGDLFKLWSLKRGAVMYFPKDHKAYTFEPHQKVSLIAGGPTFTVSDWVKQFKQAKSIQENGFQLNAEHDGFKLMTEDGFVLELQRKSQKEMKLVPRIFEPVLPAGTDIIVWEES